MKLIRVLLVLLVCFSFLGSPFPGAEEKTEETVDLPGDPDCRACHGTGIITPQTIKKGKSKTKQRVMYCYYKAQGKRCDILIGGWEPCSVCADMPTMAGIHNEYRSVVGHYQGNAEKYLIMKNEAGFNYNYAEGVHYALCTNVDHSSVHGVIDAVEVAWDLFAVEWGLLTPEEVLKQPMAYDEPETEDEGKMEGVYWDRQWRNSKTPIYMFSSKDEYLKFIDWYWDKGGAAHDMGGKEMLKGCASIGVSGRIPAGRATYWRGETETHCSLVHMCGHSFLDAQGYKRIPHWIDEGFAKYMEYRVKNATLTHCIAYGVGTKADEAWQDSNQWRGMLKQAAAVKDSRWDEAGRRWIGLIPFDLMMQYKIENMSWQGMAQSWGLVTYLMGEGANAADKRRYVEKFKQLMRGIGGTKLMSPEEQAAVVQEVYGMTAAELFESWRQWLLKKW
jgi:hypothetical protein